MPESDLVQQLSARVMELEILSAEAAAETERLQEFVSGYENRIRSLEAALRSLKNRIENPPDALPEALADLPPHY